MPSITSVLFIICLSVLGATDAAHAADVVLMTNIIQPETGLERWRFDPNRAGDPASRFKESSLTFRIGSATVTSYAAYAERPISIDPFRSDIGSSQHGTRVSIPLGSHWSLNAHAFYLMPPLPRGESLSKPGAYAAYSFTPNYEARLTQKNNGLTAGVAWKW